MDIDEELYKFNVWWEKTAYKPDFIPRPKYLQVLQRYLKNRDIILITGLRRIGKTTLMKSFIASLLETVNPKHVLYVSLDSLPLEPYTIHEIVRAFRKTCRLSLDTKTYLFLDEVAYRATAHQELKNLYDHENVKIFATSSSASILQDTRGFLTGRARVLEVLPLDFDEFLAFRGLKVSRAEGYMLESHFETFMQMGGIPEYVLTDDVSYLDHLIESVIYKDIVARYGVKDVTSIKEFFRLLMERAGKQISLNKIGRVLGVSPDTTRRYLHYFTQTFLVYTIERCGKLNERLKAPKKLYAADVGLRNYITGFRDKGAVFENLVYLKIKDHRPCYVYHSGQELDFFFEDTLLEVKYEKDLEGKQKDLFNTFKAKRKVVVKTMQDYLRLKASL